MSMSSVVVVVTVAVAVVVAVVVTALSALVLMVNWLVVAYVYGELHVELHQRISTFNMLVFQSNKTCTTKLATFTTEYACWPY